MVEPIAPVAPAIAIPPVQPAQNSASASSSASGTSTAGNASFVTAFEQAVALQDEEDLLGVDQTTTTQASGTDDSSLLDGAILANLSPQALAVISDANAGTASVNAVGNLTPTQVEEIATLENDAQILNMTETTTFSSDVSLLDSASTVNLSPQAVNILDGINASASVSVGDTLTTAQLQQIAGIITPFINQPLTPATLTQMQNALIAAGFNPTQLSLQNIFLSMSYIAELLPVSVLDGEELALSETMTTELLDT